jgi:hypothetical protein
LLHLKLLHPAALILDYAMALAVLPLTPVAGMTFLDNCMLISLGVVARPENIFLKLDLDNTSERKEISQSPSLKGWGFVF